ncbi:MAG: hypothetical protein J5I50_10415 [Chitinophagaceae bacterium]|nr:hypothetical protein [Chitinophagaceae bacterium]
MPLKQRLSRTLLYALCVGLPWLTEKPLLQCGAEAGASKRSGNEVKDSEMNAAPIKIGINSAA